MRNDLFDPADVERSSLDCYEPHADTAHRLDELLVADLEERRGEFAIVADLIEALVRHRHLIRASVALAAESEEEARLARALRDFVQPENLGAARYLADTLRG